MSRRVLGSLDSAINFAGAEAVNRTVGRERTHVERQALWMNERRHEAWRPLNQERVAAFIEPFLMAMLRVENAHRRGHQNPIITKMFMNTMRKRIIPWIYRRLVWTMDNSMWPMTMEHFKELDMFMAAHLCLLRADPKWQMISYFFKEVEKQRQDEWQEAFEA